MSGCLISVKVHANANAQQKAWLIMRVARREDQHLHFQADIQEALARDPVSFMHPVSDSVAKVLKSDIVGGILLARKSIGRIGFSSELHSLGGSTGEERSVLGVPSVAFGVAAHLAVLHGLGIEDLVAKPRGGFGWALTGIQVEPDTGGAPTEGEPGRG